MVGEAGPQLPQRPGAGWLLVTPCDLGKMEHTFCPAAPPDACAEKKRGQMSPGPEQNEPPPLRHRGHTAPEVSAG